MRNPPAGSLARKAVSVLLCATLHLGGMAPGAGAAALLIKTNLSPTLKTRAPVLPLRPALGTRLTVLTPSGPGLAPVLPAASIPILQFAPSLGAPLPALPAVSAAILPEATPPGSVPSLDGVQEANEAFAGKIDSLPLETSRRRAALIFEGKTRGTELSPTEGSSRSGANDGGRKAGLSRRPNEEPVPPGEVPAPSKKRSGFKRWHKWVAAIVMILTLAAGGLYVHYRPHINPIDTPTRVVQVEARTLRFEIDPAASIGTTQDFGRTVLLGPKSPVVSVAASAGGKTVVTVSEDGSWMIWDLDKGTALRPQESASAVIAARIAPDGRIFLLHKDSSVRFVDPATGRVTRIEQKAGQVSMYSFSPDLKALVVATQDNRLQIIDLATGKTRAFKTEALLTLAYTSDAVIFMSTNGPKLRIWSVKPGASPVVVMDKLAPGVVLQEAAISADGTRVAAAGEAPGAKGVLYLKDSQLIGNVPNDQLGGRRTKVASIAMDPGGERVAILTTKGQVWLWEPLQDELVLLGKTDSKSGVKVFFSSDGGRIFASDQDGRLETWPTPR